MIRINLLPLEFRRGRRVSSRLLAVSFGSVLAVCASVGWFGLTYFGRLGDVESAHAAVKARLDQKTPKAAYYDKLESNQRDYENRVKTIQTIGHSRRLWSEFLDRFIDVVNNDSDIDRHIAWFDSMTIKPDPKKGTTITMPAHVQGNDMAKVANLHESIMSAPFWHEIATMSEPQGKTNFTKERTPAESLDFPLVLTLKTDAPEAKAKKAPVAPAKKN